MFCSFQFILWLFVVILPVHPLLVCYLYFRRDNKQLINSLGTSIKAQGESTESTPASSSCSPQLGGFCRAWLRYKSHLSYSWIAVCPVFLKPCLSQAIPTLGCCGCARTSQALSKGTAQAPEYVFIMQQVEVAPQWGKSPVENLSHGTVREGAAWCCSRLKGHLVDRWHREHIYRFWRLLLTIKLTGAAGAAETDNADSLLQVQLRWNYAQLYRCLHLCAAALGWRLTKVFSPLSDVLHSSVAVTQSWKDQPCPRFCWCRVRWSVCYLCTPAALQNQRISK